MMTKVSSRRIAVSNSATVSRVGSWGVEVEG